jgi:signal transduction histidine kinase
MTRWDILPIRGRLTVAFAATMAVVLGCLSVFVYQQSGADLLQAIDAGLSSRGELLASDLEHRGPGPVNVQPTLIESDEVFAQIADASGRVLHSSSIIAGQRMLSSAAVRAAARAGEPKYADRKLIGIDNLARVLAVPVVTPQGRFVVLVGASLQDRKDALVQLATTLAIAGGIALCLTSFGAWLAVTGALRPVGRMRRQTAAISASDPGRRLSVGPGKDELALLSATLNQMLDRIEDSVEGERRLVDRASHELRTPLAVQRIELDLALSGPQTVAELQAALRSVSQENEHLARLTEDLLVLARARAGVLGVQPEEISLADLLEDARRWNLAASGERAQVRFRADDGSVQVDPVWIRQALTNLVDNAVKHTPPDGEVLVTASNRDGRLVLTVDDTGPGFSQASINDAFEPLARSSHSRADGSRSGFDSTGLGLAIVQAIVEAHGGYARAENLPNGGARVTLTISDGEQAVSSAENREHPRR